LPARLVVRPQQADKEPRRLSPGVCLWLRFGVCLPLTSSSPPATSSTGSTQAGSEVEAPVPQSAVHVCNAMDNQPHDLRVRCEDLFRRIAARLRPVPLGCESRDALVRKRKTLLTKLKKGAGTISGDRYELWFTVVRVQGASCSFVPSLPVCNPLRHRTTNAQKSTDPPSMRTIRMARSELRRFS
jgi:hypothetical protein